MVYVAIATGFVVDGLLIGAGSAVSSQFAIVLALGQVVSSRKDLPSDNHNIGCLSPS